jgi:hypothetical protein
MTLVVSQSFCLINGHEVNVHAIVVDPLVDDPSSMTCVRAWSYTLPLGHVATWFGSLPPAAIMNSITADQRYEDPLFCLTALSLPTHGCMLVSDSVSSITFIDHAIIDCAIHHIPRFRAMTTTINHFDSPPDDSFSRQFVKTTHSHETHTVSVFAMIICCTALCTY